MRRDQSGRAARTAITMMLGLLSLPGYARGEQDSLERAFAVPGHGTLRLEVPAMWQTTLSDTGKGGPPTIQFAPISGGGFLLLVTPMGLAPTEGSRQDPEANRRLVEEWGAENLERAVEEDLPIFPIEGPQASGYGAKLTDSDPGPDEYLMVTFGAVAAGDLRVVFTILTHRADDPAIERGLAMIRGARQTGGMPAPQRVTEPGHPGPVAAPGGSNAKSPEPPEAPGASPAESLRRLTFPGRAWSLVVDLPSFEFTRKQTRDDGRGIMVFGENSESNVLISIFIEEAAREGDHLACRKYYWKKLRRKGAKKSGMRLSERDGIALVEYLIEEASGFRVNHKNVNAYLSHDGLWIDVHLSKVAYEESEWGLFEEVLRSIRIAE